MVAKETDGLNPDIDWTLELMFKLSPQQYFQYNIQLLTMLDTILNIVSV